MHPTMANRSSTSGRKEKEKHRRMKMKNLCSKLASVLPNLTSKEKLPLPALLDVSLNHVKSLKERINELKAKKERLEGISTCTATRGLVVPTIAVHGMGSTLEVNLVTDLNNTFMLIEVLKILEEQGAQVVSASYATSRDCIIHSIHCQAFSPRIGIDTSSVIERLKRLSGEEHACMPTTI